MQRLAIDEDLSRGSAGAALRRAILAGLLVGALDFVFAMTIWGAKGVPPIVIPQSVASGLLGADAFQGGITSAILGTCFHFMLTILFAIGYLKLAPDRLKAHPAVAGPASGAAIWIVMNKVVVPLSAAPLQPPPNLIAAADFVAHMLLVGMPIAFLLRMPVKKG